MLRGVQSRHPVSQRGVTLVELLVGLLVGLIVLAGITNVFVASIRANAVTLGGAKLNHEVRTVAEIVSSDLRRSGFHQPALTPSGGAQGVDNTAWASIELSADGSCVRFRYNDSNPLDANAAPQPTFGFRRVEIGGVGVVAMEVARTDRDCANWPATAIDERLTDERRVNITDFTLRTTGSRCYNLDRRDLEDPDAQALSDWSWTAADDFSFPCDEAAVDAAVTAGLAESGDLLVESRQLRLVVTGAAVGSELQTTVESGIHLPNNRRLRVPE